MSEVILVEGLGDVDFIDGFMKKIGKAHVTSFPPKPLGGAGNGVSNVISIIPLLINKIIAGDFTKAAIVVDADYTGVNGGFLARRNEIRAKLISSGYSVPQSPLAGAAPGEIFTHPNGHAPIGLFIFPDHQSDGMLEDLLKKMVIDPNQSALMQHAMTVVGNPPAKFFNTQLHTSKAQIGTFLAWQQRPPAFTNVCLSQDIFDVSAPAVTDFLAWINRVF